VNMNSFKKHFLVAGAAIAIIGGASVVFAGSISDTYNTNDTLTAAKMTTIKNAVNDNDTRITALGNCAAGMTKVGATCVDQAQVGNSMSWGQALDACRLAGKRLLTPGELYAAFKAGAISITDGNSEWVDAVVAEGSDNTGFGGSGSFGVGRMGPDIGSTGGTSGSGVLGFVATDTAVDVPGSSVGFRCAK
jgi:hypothetical protein